MMPAVTFDINQRAVIDFTNKLGGMAKYDLPVAIRGTLDEVAYQGKKEATKKFKKNFHVKPFARKFPVAHIWRQKSINTFDVDKMVSEVGMIRGKKNIGQRVARQERGAFVHKKNIPTKEARVGGNPNSPINRGLYIRLFIKKKKGLIYKSGESHIIKTNDRILRVSRGSVWKTLYIINRDIRIESRPFIAFGAKKASKNINKIYHEKAGRRIKKRMAKFMK